MAEQRFNDEELTGTIIDAIIKVHRTLGPGFIESVYRNAMLIELGNRGLKVEMEKYILIYYEGKLVGRHRLDLFVEERVVLELKTVEELCRANYAQLRSQLKAGNIKLGMLVNFATEKADFRRVEMT